jgi:hypothetical protein
MARGKLSSIAPFLDADPRVYAAINDLYIYLSQQEDTSIVYSQRYDEQSSTLGFLGEASPGTLSSAPSWRIRKLVYAADGDVTITWADGNSLFDNVWDNRASLTYI